MHTDYESYIEQRLKEWAHWHIKSNDKKIKLPAEAKLRGRGHATQQYGYHTFNPDVKKMESLIAELRKHNKNLALTLSSHYLRTETTSEKAKYFKVSASQFRISVAMAKQWLLGRLSM